MHSEQKSVINEIHHNCHVINDVVYKLYMQSLSSPSASPLSAIGLPLSSYRLKFMSLLTQFLYWSFPNSWNKLISLLSQRKSKRGWGCTFIDYINKFDLILITKNKEKHICSKTASHCRPFFHLGSDVFRAIIGSLRPSLVYFAIFSCKIENIYNT